MCLMLMYYFQDIPLFWGKVLKPFFEDLKQHQPVISQPRGNLLITQLACKIHMASTLVKSIVMHLTTISRPQVATRSHGARARAHTHKVVRHGKRLQIRVEQTLEMQEVVRLLKSSLCMKRESFSLRKNKFPSFFSIFFIVLIEIL